MLWSDSMMFLSQAGVNFPSLTSQVTPDIQLLRLE